MDALIAKRETAAARRRTTWDALWSRRSIGRVATAVAPSAGRLAQARIACADLPLKDPEALPPRWTPQWREHLLDDLAVLSAQADLPGDAFMGLSINRAFHGQSQGLADLFGCRVEQQPDGYFHVHPLAPEPAAVAAVRPGPLDRSLYWAAVEYARYARRATDGRIPIRAPVMTGPLDTANYLLGSTVLMEWIYTERQALKSLLATVTDTIARMILELQEAAGGVIHPQLFWCMRGGPDLCSELRAIVSADTYEEFEAPYLREIARRVGPIAVHSCGDWARTVPSACADSCIRAMNGGSREVDVAALCRASRGRMTLSIYRSQNCRQDLIWSGAEDFWDHILRDVPVSQPMELTIPEQDIPLWNSVCRKHGRTGSMLKTV